MNEIFLEKIYFDFLTFKNLKSETQALLNEFCDYYLDNYKGSNKDNLEYLRLFFSKFLKDNHKDSIFLSMGNDYLKICIYDFDVDFLKINNSLKSLNKFITDFKNFLKEF